MPQPVQHLIVRLDLAAMAGYAAAGQRAAQWFEATTAHTGIDRGCGGMFLLLAGALALLRRPLTNG